MPKEMDRYGTVKVISGKFKGRIGYYDDDDSIFPENYEWNEEDDDDETIEGIIHVAIVYFGHFSLATEHHGISYDDLEYASMYDLVNRKAELTKLCSPYNKISYKKLCGYFSELHYIETTLLNQIVEQRYMNKPNGAKFSFLIHHWINRLQRCYVWTLKQMVMLLGWMNGT